MVRPRPTRAGFTIIDLMIVVVIIGVMAALAAPTVSTAMADRRTNQAAIDTIRLFREARSDAMMYGRATVVDFNMLGTAGGVGTKLRLIRGRTSSCNTTDWTSVITGGGCGVAGGVPACVDHVYMTDYAQGGFQTGLTSSLGAVGMWCFQPNGAVMARTAGHFSETQLQGGWRITVQRRDGTTPVGVARQISVALGGDARLVR